MPPTATRRCRRVSPSTRRALLGLLLLGGVLSLVDLLHGRPSTLLRKGLLGLGWLALVAWLGLLFYLQRLYGLTF